MRRTTAAVYDLLGFLSPYVLIRSKLLIQKAWLEARDWDELLPTHHQREWTGWFRELDDLELVKKIIQEVQSKVYAAEIEPLRRHKEILRGSTLAPFNPVSVHDTLRSNTRVQHADNLPYDVKCPIKLP